MTIKNMEIQEFQFGIYLSGSSHNTIYGNNIANNWWGIYFQESSNNNIYGNNITAHMLYGISLYSYSSYNSISGNNITNNGDGIYLSESSNNKFYHNSFIKNTRQVYDEFWDYPWFTPSINIWDDGYPSGGNCWSDYRGVDADADGIGDAPYAIDANNVDRYPLIAPITVFDVGAWNGVAYNVDVVSNSTVSNFQLDVLQKMVSFNVTGMEGTAGFCRITIPNIIVQDLWQGNYTVLLNGEPWPFRNWTDTTNTYIYINYTHSQHQITIVPEFPSAMTLPLFMVLTMLSAAFAKRRFPRKINS